MHAVVSAVPAVRAIDDLDRDIVRVAARINAVTYELLCLVREFDERAGWLKWGFDHCAEWLHWRCDISLGAAREKVRVAHALKTLPLISKAFAAGKLSYSKVRALVRVATVDNEAALLAFALKTTASSLEERCRELRFGDAAAESPATPEVRRSLSVIRNPEAGIMRFTLELPMDTGLLLEKALDKARDDDLTDGSEMREMGWSARQADALVTLARAFLAGGANDGTSSTPTPPNYQVTVHVDHSALQGQGGRAGLPLQTVKRLGCDADAVLLVENGHGEPLSVGRKTRIIPSAIRRALWARDRGCRFPVCQRKRFVEGHHIRHWSAGGETSLDNLLLLCSHHHTMVHEGQFRIDKDYNDEWCFRRPDGRAVPACGFRKDDVTDDDVDAGPDSESAVQEPTPYYAAGKVVKFPTRSGTTPRSRRSSQVPVCTAGEP
jgi:hypothetical protein